MLQRELTGPVLRLTLDRPEVRNAFNDELIKSLTDAFSDLDPSVRAVVISGNGSAFCAGGDLEWMRKAASYEEDENVRDATKLARLFRAIHDCRAVTLTCVQGACFGGGCGLVAASDVSIASTDAKFAFSEVRLGLIPATISPFVIEKIGRGAARALFATGEMFDASHALSIGLVHEMIDPTQMTDALDRKLKAILAAGPEAVRAAKKLIFDGELTLDECAKRLARARASREGKEGVTAFLEKRKATYVVEWPLGE